MKERKKQSLQLSGEQVQRQDLRLFTVLSSPEKDFLEQEAELLADPLFSRLCSPGEDGSAPVVRRRLPGAAYAFFRACADDGLASAAERSGAGEWLSARPAMLELARRAGAGNFEKYFLSSSLDPKAAAKACGFTGEEVSALRAFTDSFILAHERVPAASLPRLYFRLSAVIVRDGGSLFAAYTHPSYFRGAYFMDRSALSRLVRSGAFTTDEARRAYSLLARAQRLSWRKAGFHRVLEALIRAQEGFLSGRSGLKPLTQRDLAALTGLDPATVSRLVSSRSVEAPWGEEIRMKDLFLTKKAFIIDKIKTMTGAGSAKITDREISEALRKDCGLRVSRRSVNLYRAGL